MNACLLAVHEFNTWAYEREAKLVLNDFFLWLKFLHFLYFAYVFYKHGFQSRCQDPTGGYVTNLRDQEMFKRLN